MQFRRTNKGGYSSVVLSAGGRQPTEVEVFLGIRINLVEELIYQFTSGLTGYGSYSTTLLVPTRKIASEFPYFYSLATNADIPVIVPQIMQFLIQRGWTFLEKYHSVKSLDALYNQEPTQKSPYLTNEFHRALRGIALAKLAQRPDWEHLVKQYQSNLQKKVIPETQMQNFARLANFLRYHSFS
ncbi:MAG: hypothetical protein AAF944_09525 [Bacteroidota bacterium]